MVIDRRELVPVYPKTLNNRAQFFLLAAVIISAVVISFGVTTNSATVTKEPKDFYYFSHNINKETNAVLNYEVYSGFTNNDNLTEFVNLVSNDIKNNMQNSNFLFIYGNNESMKIKYYGRKDASVDNKSLGNPANEIKSRVCLEGFCKDVSNKLDDFKKRMGDVVLNKSVINNAKNISVLFDGQEFVFPISKRKKVIFILRRDVGNERFVSIK